MAVFLNKKKKCSYLINGLEITKKYDLYTSQLQAWRPGWMVSIIH